MAALTVITGIYGMNFEFMPELHWRFGYLFVWAVMAVVTGALWWVFRKKQWI
jgi:magnesium transporter